MPRPALHTATAKIIAASRNEPKDNTSTATMMTANTPTLAIKLPTASSRCDASPPYSIVYPAGNSNPLAFRRRSKSANETDGKVPADINPEIRFIRLRFIRGTTAISPNSSTSATLCSGTCVSRTFNCNALID